VIAPNLVSPGVGIGFADEPGVRSVHGRQPHARGAGRNPYGGLPVLELDDGTCIAESVAICRYFEDLHPQPALVGVDAKDRAVVEMWNRRMELARIMREGLADVAQDVESV